MPRRRGSHAPIPSPSDTGLPDTGRTPGPGFPDRTPTGKGATVRMRRAPWMLSIAAITLIAEPTSKMAHATVFDTWIPERHERWLAGFENPGFILADRDLSGLAIDRPGALVSPRHYISAMHISYGLRNRTAQRPDGDNSLESLPEITFVDRHGVTHERRIVKVTEVMWYEDGQRYLADIAVYELDRDLPPTVAVYPIADNDGWTGREFFVLGGPAGCQAGRNRITSEGRFSLGGSKLSHSLAFTFDTTMNGSDGGLGADEAGVENGDSGWPSFADVDGRLVLLGAGLARLGLPPAAYTSFITSFPAHREQIHEIIGYNACPGDWNDNGHVDIVDLLDYFADFAALDPSADLDRDGAHSFFDLLEFFAMYGDGCEG